MTSQDKAVKVSELDEGRVVCLTLGGSRGNIISMRVMQEMMAALEVAASNPSLRLVILRTEGRHFSFGASVEEHRKDQAAQMLSMFHKTARALAAFPVPVASIVQGKCLGGAFEVVLCSHFVFAVPGAVFSCPEISLGVLPPVLAAIGPLRLGGATTERLLLTGGEMGTEEASRLGWLTQTLCLDSDPMEQVLTWYREKLAPLSAYSLRTAVAATRDAGGMTDALGQALDRAERHYVEGLIPSHDGNEGIEAFLARRSPQWKDA